MTLFKSYRPRVLAALTGYQPEKSLRVRRAGHFPANSFVVPARVRERNPASRRCIYRRLGYPDG